MNRNLIKRDIYSILNIKHLFLTVITAILISSYMVYRLNGNIESLIDYLVILFSGPSIHSDDFFSFLIWFFPLVIFMYIIFNFLYCEWDGIYRYTILRIGSTGKWIICKMCSLLICSSIYIIIFYILASLVGIIYGYKITDSSNLGDYYMCIGNYNIYEIIYSNIIMLLLNLMFISVAALLLSYIFKRNTYSYIILCLIYIEPYFLKNTYENILLVFPAEHAILSRHSLIDLCLQNNTIYFAYSYMILFLIIIAMLLNSVIKKYDLS